MFLEMKDFLRPEEVAKLRELASMVQFVDGRISNPHNLSKNNLQANVADPAYAESSRIVAEAFMRSEPFRDFAFPADHTALHFLCHRFAEFVLEHECTLVGHTQIAAEGEHALALHFVAEDRDGREIHTEREFVRGEQGSPK